MFRAATPATRCRPMKHRCGRLAPYRDARGCLGTRVRVASLRVTGSTIASMVEDQLSPSMSLLHQTPSPAARSCSRRCSFRAGWAWSVCLCSDMGRPSSADSSRRAAPSVAPLPRTTSARASDAKPALVRAPLSLETGTASPDRPTRGSRLACMPAPTSTLFDAAARAVRAPRHRHARPRPARSARHLPLRI
jgi:hypothetical protein